MSSDVEPRASLVENILAGRISSRVLAGVGCALALLVVVPIVVLLLRTGPEHPKGPGESGTKDEVLEQVGTNLSRETDLVTVKNALQQVNAYFNSSLDQRPRGLPAAERPQLQREMALSDEDLGDIGSGNYSNLDANYLDSCFLFRDAVRAIQSSVALAAADDPSVRLTPLEKATAAFHWMTRQVRLEEHAIWTWSLPPHLCLRRGRGTALERALVFLELVRQLNVDDENGPRLTGCLLGTGTKAVPEGDQPVWAVGVLIDNDVYLFDPRLGLPVPGPKGQGVATLAQVLKDSQVLDQLTVDEKFPYDMTADKVRTADVYVYAPLPALAPRLVVLQKLLASRVHVNLTADPASELAQIQTAVAAAGAKPGKLAVHAEGLRVLRQFLPPEEGGADRTPFGLPLTALAGFAELGNPAMVRMTRQLFFDSELVPWLGLPDSLKNSEALQYNTGLGSFIRAMFARAFRHSTLETGGARDRILRGDYTKAIPDLMAEHDGLTAADHELQTEIQAAGGRVAFETRVRKFLFETMVPAAAEMERAKLKGPEAAAREQVEVEKKWFGNRDVNLLLQGSIASRRLAEVTYLIALAKHEQAEQFQLRADALGRRHGSGPSPEDVGRTKEFWNKAEPWWRDVMRNYPQGPLAAVARRPRGRCQMILGDWHAALVSWEDMTDPLPQSQFDRPAGLAPLEKTGNLFLAHQLRKQHDAAKP